ncbi:MAG TPA: 30S ribosomal protein S16 [Chitinophagales bacterium]|nr:30S ribosomal protein S16 [Chitinophagales bacterium]HMX03455.1 30S ribosomal protein S16 [Chitinophagales bacterium]HMZ88328.1 30S ribosomal protein S16 [Chitinophagales bacterium]HNA56469.1 30S ribosomal protein S16 [Chitinophagales bacterium]HNE44840.1 30S ribosomal protein S16 [Chitinophagales bacterium]
MATKIRLQRHGRKKAPFYHIVVADVRAPRDGKFIERLGSYNPTTVPAQIIIDVDKAVDWLQKGAQPTTTVNAILRYKGVLYKKHLLRGVAKGAFTTEVADQKFDEWVKSHETAVIDKVKAIEASAAATKAAEVARINAKRLEEASKKAAAEREAEAAATVETATEEAAVEETTSEAANDATTEETTNE